MPTISEFNTPHTFLSKQENEFKSKAIWDFIWLLELRESAAPKSISFKENPLKKSSVGGCYPA